MWSVTSPRSLMTKEILIKLYRLSQAVKDKFEKSIINDYLIGVYREQDRGTHTSLRGNCVEDLL